MILDDGFPESAAALQVGPAGCWLHVCAIAWSTRHRTGGALPTEVLPRLADVDEPDHLADRLAAAGVWAVTADGWQIAGFRQSDPVPRMSRWERRIAR